MAAEPENRGGGWGPEPAGRGRAPRVAVIGPCVSGKSTIAAALRARGVAAFSVAQEHTVIPDLWRHGRPDLLVYLDVSYEEAARRREIFWGPERHQEQKEFLKPAREAADLVIATDGLTVWQVVSLVLESLRRSDER